MVFFSKFVQFVLITNQNCKSCLSHTLSFFKNSLSKKLAVIGEFQILDCCHVASAYQFGTLLQIRLLFIVLDILNLMAASFYSSLFIIELFL